MVIDTKYQRLEVHSANEGSETQQLGLIRSIRRGIKDPMIVITSYQRMPSRTSTPQSPRGLGSPSTSKTARMDQLEAAYGQSLDINRISSKELPMYNCIR